MTTKPTTRRPIAGGTNNGLRPMLYDYWRVGYGLPDSYPLEFWVEFCGEFHTKSNYLSGPIEPTHWTEFYYNIDGYASLHAPSGNQHFKAGDYVVVPAGQPLCYQSTVGVKYHWLALSGVWPAVLGQPRLYHHSLGLDNELAEKFNETREVLLLRHAGYQLQAVGLLYEILARVEELTRPSGEPESGYPETVRNALVFLRENYAAPFSASRTAQAVNISQSHLRALFEKWLGASPKQIHTRYRIDQAKRLISEQKLPLTMVAERVGFTDAHHFSRVFKQVTGIAPSHYANAQKYK